MATKAYDPQNFSLQTKLFEQQFFDSAVSQAQQLASESGHVKVHRMTRKICNQAFDSFKTQIQATFPYEDYRDLISLTLKSRENLFFIDLKDRGNGHSSLYTPDRNEVVLSLTLIINEGGIRILQKGYRRGTEGLSGQI